MKNNKHFGFGIMRLPLNEGKYDKENLCQMVDAFIKNGFNYFDTAYGYMDGQSEIALRECVVERYPRKDIVIADKLSDWFIEKEEDIAPLFEKQLEKCGVTYFDNYLFHCITKVSYKKHKDLNSFKIIESFKKQGKIRHIGMSFHDSAEVLDEILSKEPLIEFVQLQINYLDYFDPTVQSKACYDVAVKHGKKVIVMEPVKGGSLINVPDEAKQIFGKLGGSPASYALRFALDHPAVSMVLSGMNSIEMVEENTKTMNQAVPLTIAERESLFKVADIIRKSNVINCSGCNYCLDVCPVKIPVSKAISIYNEFVLSEISKACLKTKVENTVPEVSECLECGKCEGVCPQKIKIRESLDKMKKL